MKLIFAYIKSFKNIRELEFMLSDDYDVSFERNKLTIQKTDVEEVKTFLYGGNLIKDMHIIVGRTGAGKTNLLQLIGMDFTERSFSENAGSYFLLYKCDGDENRFAIEVYNMFIPQITKTAGVQLKGKKSSPKFGFWQFQYDFKRNELKGIYPVEDGVEFGTAIVNTFDRNAFAKYPYHDVVEPAKGNWLPRKVTPYSESFPAKIVNAAREYVEQMPDDSIKRKASFVISRINWQYKLNVELPHDLLESEYWLYGERRLDGVVQSLSDIPYASPITGRLQKGKSRGKATPKEMFLHDLLTDYAIYLRKVASSVTLLGNELPKYRPLHKVDDIDTPTVLPDNEKDLTLEKRLMWLGQYIDYHTDGMNGNKGLVWQECKEICDMIKILDKFEDKYFTPDQFIYPLVEVDENDKRFYDLFESMGQYHRDQYEIFPKEYLPYTLTYLSSGEFQFAKIWGALEEAIETKLAKGYKNGKPEEIKEMHLIVLMDEPETYMHPEYCREFIYRTVKILERRNPGLQLQLIISTHSPFMLSDTISSQVTCVDYDDDGECIIYEPTEKPFFAANIFSIMADGFFLDYTIGEYARSFLTEKFAFLKGLADRYPNITPEELEQVKKMRTVLPYIGDEMIRRVFERLLDYLAYA